MAIKGNLSDITFIELLKIIGSLNGKLNVWNFKEKKQYECFFYDQAVIYLNFCGNPVTTEESVKDVFLELITDDRSYYAFQHEKFSEAERVPIVSVKELMDLSLFETPEANDELLPHLNTRFETVNKVDFELQGALADFWKATIGLLHHGCSGYDICIKLGLEEKHVRRNLYKLRTTGLIKPVRMFSAANSLAKSAKTRQHLSRLAGSLPSVSHVQTATTSAPKTQSAAMPLTQKMSTGATAASWQKPYLGRDRAETPMPQPVVTVHTENVAPPTSSFDSPPPPDFPWLNGEASAFTHDDIFAEPIAALPVETVDEPVYEHFDRALDEAPGAQEAPPAFSVQISEPPAAPLDHHAVAAAETAPLPVQNETVAPAQNLISPARTGLLKRMLNSLFRN